MLVSVVTPVRNAVGTISRALESVAECRDVDLEHVVVDGLSDDGTVDVLARAPGIRWVSAPDRNLYDALNRGIRMADGGFVHWLNGDDEAVPSFLAAAAETLERRPDLDAVHGDTVVIDVSGREVGRRRYRDGELDDFLGVLRGAGFVQVNSMLLRRELFDRLGFFDDRFPLLADFDFVLRMARARVRVARLPIPAYRFRAHAGSLTGGADTGVRVYTDLVAVYERWLSEGRVPEACVGPLKAGLGKLHLALAVGHLTGSRDARSSLRWLGRMARRYPTGVIHLPALARRFVERAAGSERPFFWARQGAAYW